MAQITDERLAELEKAEDTLLALEGGGVHNWEGYESAMEEIRSAEKFEDYLGEIAGEIEEAACSHINEPAGRGGDGTVSCGYGIDDKGIEKIVAILKRFVPKP